MLGGDSEVIFLSLFLAGDSGAAAKANDKESSGEKQRLRVEPWNLREEAGVLERLVYKHKNQHRGAAYFQYLLKVGVTGYCMGGALSIASGVLAPEVDAVVAFYGTPSSELADPAKAQAPIQAHFGELDSFVGFADVTAAKSLEEKLDSAGVPHEVHIYPGCSHAFMNSSAEAVKRRKEMGLTDENQGAIDLAWSRFSAWMGRYLGSA